MAELTPELVNGMKVSELRKALEERGLDSTGTKGTLVERLLERLAEEEEAAAFGEEGEGGEEAGAKEGEGNSPAAEEVSAPGSPIAEAAEGAAVASPAANAENEVKAKEAKLKMLKEAAEKIETNIFGKKIADTLTKVRANMKTRKNKKPESNVNVAMVPGAAAGPKKRVSAKRVTMKRNQLIPSYRAQHRVMSKKVKASKSLFTEMTRTNTYKKLRSTRVDLLDAEKEVDEAEMAMKAMKSQIAMAEGIYAPLIDRFKAVTGLKPSEYMKKSGANIRAIAAEKKFSQNAASVEIDKLKSMYDELEKMRVEHKKLELDVQKKKGAVDQLKGKEKELAKQTVRGRAAEAAREGLAKREEEQKKERERLSKLAANF